MRSLGGYLLKILLLVVAYLAAARLGLRFASLGESISLVWPPTGIAFAALVLLGLRYWPGVALGAFLANAATSIPPLAAGQIALGNTLEAVVAAALLVRFAGPRPDLEKSRSIRALILLAAPVATLVSASIGVLSLWIHHLLTVEMVPTALALWWAGDLLGALVVAPLILVWSLPYRSHRDTRGIVEIIALCLGTAAAAEFGLGRFLPVTMLGQLEYPFLLFPFVIWAALRFGVRGVTLLTLMVSVVAVWHTVHGSGPFLSATPLETLLAINSYLAILAVTGLVLAAAVSWERQGATRALEESRDQLRRALEAARMGTWTWSVANNTLIWDEGLRNLYRLRPDETVSSYSDFIRRVHPDDRAMVEEAVQKSLHQGEKLDYEFRIMLPDGSVRWIADQGHVLYDDQGVPLALTGVCMDITDRRISEERLRQAHRMESVGRLAGGVAHETNNQMSVVLGAARFVLMRTDLADTLRSDVEQIERAAERTASVTAQLLAFSRRQIMNRQVLDLNALIQSWEPLLRRIMGEDCAVRLVLDPMLELINADAGQLHQVIINLAINARDAMPGGGSLLIETSTTTLTQEYAQRKPGVSIQPGSYVRLAVSDSGHGMSRESLERVFEPFFTTKDIGQGTGLGLSTVYGIVKQSEGYVWAYSEPGQGATFKLYFPVTSEAPRQETIAQESPSRGRGERILVVEDEDGVRQVIVRALSEAGFRVLQASSGEQALALYAAEPSIDLLLTDVVMPGMNGRELAQGILDQTPHLPVIYTSGYTDGEIARRGLLEPGANFMQKPFNPEALVKAVNDQLAVSARSTD